MLCFYCIMFFSRTVFWTNFSVSQDLATDKRYCFHISIQILQKIRLINEFYLWKKKCSVKFKMSHFASMITRWLHVRCHPTRAWVRWMIYAVGIRIMYVAVGRVSRPAPRRSPHSIDRATLPPRYFPRDVASSRLLFRQIIVTRVTGVSLLVASCRCSMWSQVRTEPAIAWCLPCSN